MLDQLLQLVLCLASVATAIHLLRAGLFRRYPFFFAYLVLRTPCALAPFLVNTASRGYLRFWLFSEPLFCLLYILIVLELYRLVLANYRGLHTVGRWAMYAFSVTSIALSALTFIPGRGNSGLSRPMSYVLSLQRGVDLSLVIFLILMLLFLSRYPVRLSHNVRVYAFVYPIFFLSNVVQVLTYTIFAYQLVHAANVAMSALSLAATLTLLVGLKRDGEGVPEPKSELTPRHTQVLLSQLDQINTALLRVSGGQH